ncbi:OmpA family protein [uncultured Erythrobacter sp.]|uniref:OmpA family protein n=1 Tax=uncultured Erythrobacter sp. TaxID=263913 RepID=UPI0026036BC8|nr:OmpA family protein [uncultured Erythrobacter sp.]
MHRPRFITALALTGALFALSACDVKQDEGAATPDPEAGATPSGGPSEAVSILRPDVEAEQELAIGTPLEPLNVTIGFPEGGSELDEAALAGLREVLASDQIVLGGPIVLRAHSDAGGSDAVNSRASEARGLAVAEWMVAAGIDSTRIDVIVFGEQNPVEPNALPDGSPNEEGRALNRRVEILIVPPAQEAVEAQAPTETSTESGD